MAEIQAEIAELKARLCSLERSNRKWRTATVMLLVSLTSLGAMAFRNQYSSPGNAEFNSLTCERLVLLDKAGREILSIGTGKSEPRASIATGEFKGSVQPWLPDSWGADDPTIWFWGANGSPQALMYPRGLVLYQQGGKGASVIRSAFTQTELSFNDLDQKLAILLGGTPPAGRPLTPQEKFRRELDTSLPPVTARNLLINSPSGGGILLGANSDGPTLWLHDNANLDHSLILGHTTLLRPQTGMTANTSAASILMFGKEHKVIWQAPLP